MSGTISLSLSQQFDSSGDPLDGGLLYFFQAGTTTPQSAYQDTALTIPHPNPIILDAAGRVPQFFLSDGEIKIRLTNAEGVTQLAADNILVIGASSGTGGTSVDATKIFDTGDLKVKYGTGVLSGFVRSNGRTIGSVTSGATERANADCQELFEYLWDADGNLSVSGGHGASAAVDWAANKTIALPDWRGRLIAGLDDMGTSAAGRLTATYFGTSAIILGAAAGSESRTLSQPHLPNVAPLFTGIQGAVSVLSTNTNVAINSSMQFSYGAGGLAAAAITPILQLQSTGFFTPAGTVGSINPSGASAFATVQPTMLATIYIRL